MHKMQLLILPRRWRVAGSRKSDVPNRGSGTLTASALARHCEATGTLLRRTSPFSASRGSTHRRNSGSDIVSTSLLKEVGLFTMKDHVVIKSMCTGMIYMLLLLLALFFIREGCRIVLVVEDEDTATVSFDVHDTHPLGEIASRIRNVTVYYKANSGSGFDRGASLRWIEKLPRIASFNDSKQIVEIMNLLRYDAEEKPPEGIKRSGLRVYYIVFYYRASCKTYLFVSRKVR